MVVAVSMGPPEGVARYSAEHRLAVPLFADPERKLYAALGAGRTSWGRLLRPGLVWKYLRLIVRGWKVRRVPEGEDALQLGGDFLFVGDRQLRWAYRSTDPTDRPSVAELLRVVDETIDGRRTPA
jgi:AhpC/TSA antioxidant enzyme